MDRPNSPQDGDSPLFGAPLYERGRKRRRFGAGAQSAPIAATTLDQGRTFDSGPSDREASSTRERAYEAVDVAAFSDPGLGAPVVDPVLMTPANTEVDPGLARDRDAQPPTNRRSGASLAAIALGVMAIGAIGGAAWYVSQDDGVAELTPSSAVVADAPAPMTLPVAPQAIAEPARTVEAEPVTRSPAGGARTASVSRVRPAVSSTPSASDAGVAASATALPDAPQPYSTMNPSSTVVPEVAPAPIPATPPIAADPAPAVPTSAPDTSVNPAL